MALRPVTMPCKGQVNAAILNFVWVRIIHDNILYRDDACCLLAKQVHQHDGISRLRTPADAIIALS